MITRRAVLAFIEVAIASPARAKRPEIFRVNNNVAVNGYDVANYFTKGAHVQGSPDFVGATWHFASAESRNMFDLKLPLKPIPRNMAATALMPPPKVRWPARYQRHGRL